MDLLLVVGGGHRPFWGEGSVGLGIGGRKEEGTYIGERLGSGVGLFKIILKMTFPKLHNRLLNKLFIKN